MVHDRAGRRGAIIPLFLRACTSPAFVLTERGRGCRGAGCQHPSCRDRGGTLSSQRSPNLLPPIRKGGPFLVVPDGEGRMVGIHKKDAQGSTAAHPLRTPRRCYGKASAATRVHVLHPRRDTPGARTPLGQGKASSKEMNPSLPQLAAASNRRVPTDGESRVLLKCLICRGCSSPSHTSPCLRPTAFPKD